MPTKKRLHALVDALPEEEYDAAERVLEGLRLRGRLPRELRDAPVDDEPYTEEDRAAVEEAEAELERDEGRSLEEAKRELGL